MSGLPPILLMFTKSLLGVDLAPAIYTPAPPPLPSRRTTKGEGSIHPTRPGMIDVYFSGWERQGGRLTWHKKLPYSVFRGPY
ncbi:hypothetical protein B0H14DRAFT_2741490 [Mycena olivaceomarginata]|nr:hypothetical protein B0H14DRAFT_2741490 [Mycena olivaceomarginata]